MQYALIGNRAYLPGSTPPTPPSIMNISQFFSPLLLLSSSKYSTPICFSPPSLSFSFPSLLLSLSISPHSFPSLLSSLCLPLSLSQWHGEECLECCQASCPLFTSHGLGRKTYEGRGSGQVQCWSGFTFVGRVQSGPVLVGFYICTKGAVRSSASQVLHLYEGCGQVQRWSGFTFV